jgi:hypothetical protein
MELSTSFPDFFTQLVPQYHVLEKLPFLYARPFFISFPQLSHLVLYPLFAVLIHFAILIHLTIYNKI